MVLTPETSSNNTSPPVQRVTPLPPLVPTPVSTPLPPQPSSSLNMSSIEYQSDASVQPTTAKRSKRKKDQAFCTVDHEDTAGYSEPDTNIDGSPLALAMSAAASSSSPSVSPHVHHHGHSHHHSHHHHASPSQLASNPSSSLQPSAAMHQVQKLHSAVAPRPVPKKTLKPPMKASAIRKLKVPMDQNDTDDSDSDGDNNNSGASSHLSAEKHQLQQLQQKERELKKKVVRIAPRIRPPLSMDPEKKRNRDLWEEKERQERERIKEFWLSLTDDQRRELVKLEKEAVLKKMKEQQKHTCSCSVCGRRRTVIEEELEMLYDAYYEELEHYEGQRVQQQQQERVRKVEEVEPEEEGGFNFAKSLTVKGGILTVADDLLKNEGKKFLEMMEKLAERRLRRDEPDEYEEEDTDEEYDDEYEEDEEEEEEMTEEQRLEEGRRMFQMFAAKMFEQRVLSAYREKVALENQNRLIAEEEEKEKQLVMKKEAKTRKAKMKKQKRKQIKQIAEEKKEQKRKEKEKEEQDKLEQVRRQQDEQRRKKEEEKKQKLEEELRKEKERIERERKQKQKEDEKKRKEDEKKKKEEAKRKKEEEKKKQEEKDKALFEQKDNKPDLNKKKKKKNRNKHKGDKPDKADKPKQDSLPSVAPQPTSSSVPSTSSVPLSSVPQTPLSSSSSSISKPQVAATQPIEVPLKQSTTEVKEVSQQQPFKTQTPTAPSSPVKVPTAVKQDQQQQQRPKTTPVAVSAPVPSPAQFTQTPIVAPVPSQPKSIQLEKLKVSSGSSSSSSPSPAEELDDDADIASLLQNLIPTSLDESPSQMLHEGDDTLSSSPSPVLQVPQYSQAKQTMTPRFICTYCGEQKADLLVVPCNDQICMRCINQFAIQVVNFKPAKPTTCQRCGTLIVEFKPVHYLRTQQQQQQQQQQQSSQQQQPHSWSSQPFNPQMKNWNKNGYVHIPNGSHSPSGKKAVWPQNAVPDAAVAPNPYYQYPNPPFVNNASWTNDVTVPQTLWTNQAFVQHVPPSSAPSNPWQYPPVNTDTSPSNPSPVFPSNQLRPYS